MAELGDAWQKAWEVPDRRPIYEWARGNIELPAGVYVQSGEFRIDGSRWMIEIFDALQDDKVQWVTVIAPVRSGKSVIADIWVPSVIVRDPGPVQWLLQTDKVVKGYAESRIHPVLRSCPGARAVWPADRHKGSTFRVEFTNNCRLDISGPALSNLQTKGVRYQVRDEAWMWEPGRLTEANGRLKDWLKIGASKALTIGQGGFKDDETNCLFLEGTQEERFVRCLHCGHLQWPRFKAERPDGSRWGIVWDAPKRDKNDHRALSELLGQILPTVRYVCEKCNQVMEDTDRTRSEWNRNSEYVAQNAKAEAGRRSFRASGTLFRNWKAMVSEFITCMDAFHLGSVELLQAFVQKELPDWWSDVALFNVDPLRKETYDVESLKKGKIEGEDARYLTVDVQDNEVYYAVARAWSRIKGCWRLWRGRLYSKHEIDAKAKEFDIQPSKVLIDAKWGAETRRVYGMCVEYGWVALMGEGERFFLHPIKKNGKTIGYVRRSYAEPAQGDPEYGKHTKDRTRRPEQARYAWLIRFSSDAMNERLQRLLDGRGIPFVNPAHVDDPEEEEEYRRQLRAEYARIKRNPITGAAKREWVCPSGNNHFRDCEKMQTVAATIDGILPDDVDQVTAAPATSSGDEAA